jgi:hypothetical protein
MQISSGTNAPVLGILTAATAARMRILNCRFLGPATSTQTCTAAIQHEVGIDYGISGCEFIGKMTQAILNATTIPGGLIDTNFLHVYAGTKAISFAAASTAFISNNRMIVASGSAPIVSAGGSFSGNRYTTEANPLSAGSADAL